MLSATRLFQRDLQAYALERVAGLASTGAAIHELLAVESVGACHPCGMLPPAYVL